MAPVAVSRFWCVLGALLYLSVLLPASARAQTAQPPSSGGGLGSALEMLGDGSDLNFTFDVNEGHDSALPLQTVSAIQRQDQTLGGLSTRVLLATNYAHASRRVRLSGSASSALRYVPRASQVAAVSRSAGIQASVNVARQASIQLAQSAIYSPSFLSQLLPAEVTPATDVPPLADSDIRVDRFSSEAYRSRLGLVLGSVAGTRVSTNVAYSRTRFPGQTSRPQLENYTASASVSRAVSRNGSFSVGYDYQTGDFGVVGGDLEMHRATLSVSLARALSVSRRATVALSLWPSTSITADPSAEGGRRQKYHTQATASLTYPFSFRWRLGASYRRTVETFAILTEPVASSGAQVQLSGSPTRRLSVSAQLRYATGGSILVEGRQRLKTYATGVRIQHALLRSLALYSEYQYYYYNLEGQSRVAPDLPRAFEQHGVRVGATLRVEALGR